MPATSSYSIFTRIDISPCTATIRRMAAHVRSVMDLGSRGSFVEIECHISNNLPSIVIVGSASKSVDEAKERVRAAFANASLQLPRKRITINLAPADLPKTDSCFDLAIAASILAASKQIEESAVREIVIIGELGLEGTVRAARGIIGKLLAGRRLGATTFIIPYDNLQQAQLVPHVTLIPVRNIKELYLFLATRTGIAPVLTGEGIMPDHLQLTTTTGTLFSEIIGQEQAKRALEIAAAGGHNVFLSGPPGTGKSMLAKALPSILPPMTHEEILEVTHLHSLVTNNFEIPVVQRPFRSPHHSASLVALIGGGHNLRPGEISLSHRGVLFLDEMPEFSRTVLEALRQPLEDYSVTVARAKETIEYPARFVLVATANPCPCGFYGSAKPCICLPHQIARYQQRISGPILDRIDLHSVVSDIDHTHLLHPKGDVKSDEQVRKRITHARAVQAQRYHSPTRLNGNMTNADVTRFAHIEAQAKTMLDAAASRLSISARSYMKTVKVARTIADLEQHESITSAHIAEALQYRRQEPVPAL